jgi:DNA mismatch repair ATPase MutS
MHIHPHTHIHTYTQAAYNKYADKLVRLGYRVGRVEQTETPAELKEVRV